MENEKSMMEQFGEFKKIYNDGFRDGRLCENEYMVQFSERRRTEAQLEGYVNGVLVTSAVMGAILGVICISEYYGEDIKAFGKRVGSKISSMFK